MMDSTNQNALKQLKILTAINAIETVLPLIKSRAEIRCDYTSEHSEKTCSEILGLLNSLLVELPNNQGRYGR
jgi:hypothetical protein